MEVKDITEKNGLVSIIIPEYNAKGIIKETLDSIEAQTYKNWEVIIVDDCSTDDSYEYIEQLIDNNPKMKLYKMPKNSGPGAATKYGVEQANGGLIAFIDSDDLWSNDKLEKQIGFMEKNNYHFTCTDYEQIDAQSKPINRTIYAKVKANYRDVILTNPIGSSTVIITKELLDTISIPEIRKDNDYALWLVLLKQYPFIYGLKETLMQYRVWNQSISHNRFKSIKYHWIVYREYEHFSCIKSIALIIFWGCIKVLRIK